VTGSRPAATTATSTSRTARRVTPSAPRTCSSGRTLAAAADVAMTRGRHRTSPTHLVAETVEEACNQRVATSGREVVTSQQFTLDSGGLFGLRGGLLRHFQ
jgi:hypothetical protein